MRLLTNRVLQQCYCYSHYNEKQCYCNKVHNTVFFYLSDVEEGGETSIPRYNIKCKPKAGRLLMFPPYWTHPHQGEKVIKGTKYIMMTYLHIGKKDDKDPR